MARKKGFFMGVLALALFVGIAPGVARAQVGQWTRGLSQPAGSVTVDPSDPWRLYSVGYTGAVFTSNDGGANWGQVALPFHASSLAVSPSRLGTIYAGGSVSTRLFRSADNGIGWSATAFRSTENLRTVAIDPRLAGDLIDLLADSDAGVRAAAQQTLVRFNRGVDLGPKPNASQAEQEAAIKKWREWWRSITR